MRFRLLAVVAVGVLSFAASLSAQDLPTTHDHGITITPDHLTNAIQETQDFWGPVRKHLVSDDCDVAAAELRKQAVAFLKSVHDGLHNCLFEKTEADALDLIHYLGHRLRRFEVYRRLRSTLNDDALMLTLLEVWERKFREIDTAPAADQPARIEALIVEINRQMEAAKLPADKLAAAVTLWKSQADVFQKMAGTSAGKMMIAFESDAGKLDPQVSELLLRISNAADWVLITRAEEQSVGREAFVKAWGELHELRSKQSTAATPSLKR